METPIHINNILLQKMKKVKLRHDSRLQSQKDYTDSLCFSEIEFNDLELLYTLVALALNDVKLSSIQTPLLLAPIPVTLHG